HRQRPAAHLRLEVVADEHRADDQAPGLADPNEDTRRIQDRLRRGQARDDGGQAPDKNARGKEVSAPPAVSQRPDGNSAKEVADREAGPEPAELRGIQLQRLVTADGRFQRADEKAVGVIEEVGQKDDSQGPGDVLTHGRSSEPKKVESRKPRSRFLSTFYF